MFISYDDCLVLKFNVVHVLLQTLVASVLLRQIHHHVFTFISELLYICLDSHCACLSV